MKIIQLISDLRPSKYLLFFGIVHLLLFPLALMGRGTLELPFNLFVAPDLFSMFNAITFIGDGLFVLVVFIIVGVIAKLKRLPLKKELVNFLIATAVMGLGIFVFKKVIFPEVTRPIIFFSTLPEGWNPENFDVVFHRYCSFPSGHTVSVATYGFFLMRYIKAGYLRILLYLAILLVGYSRVFLFQHFVADVYAGVILGILCVWGADMLTRRVFPSNN